MSRAVKTYAKPMVSISDAMLGSFQARDGGATLAKKVGSEGLQFDMAIMHFRKRAHFLGMSREMTDSAIAKGRESVHKCDDVLESPIERALLPWLVFEDYGPFMTAPANVHTPKTEAMPAKGDLLIIPQFAFIKYRLDFAVIGTLNGNRKIVAVECDGANYHGKAKDDTRDAYFQAFGVQTIRAGGDAVYSRPRSISAAVADILIEWAEANG